MVARYIKELLQESDEVIVQDLGTFHTSYCSAEIHPVSHAFVAPNKNISFQTKIKTSNFLLENYIAQKENISLEEAKEEVQKFVSTLKVSLGVEKRFALEDLGEFVLQVTDEIEFKQNKQANILKDSFGLPEIYAKPIDKNGAAPKGVATPNQTKKISTANQKIPTEEPKSTWGTVAAIGSLAFVVLAVVYVVAVDSSLNPFNALLGRKSEKKENKKQEEKILVQTETKQETQNAREENNVSKPEENNQQVTDIEPNKSEETAQKLQEAQDKVVEEKKVEEKTNKTQGDGILLENKTNQFYIVIGGFASQNNAYKIVREAKAKGVKNVKIVPPFDAKNLYRVAVGAFATREQAEANLEEIKNTFNVEAWVLKY
jgi:nucleoid DNA-binding protein